ncbi:hypothetical protein O1L55_01845 [Streptomyces albulus]|nr:hypothetical protein [Streptomyces noursei]
MRDRRYLAYLVAVLLNSAVYIQYLSTLPLALRAQGYSTFWYGAMVAVNGAVVICFELLMTKVVQSWRIRTVLTVGFVLLGAGMALYALPGGLAVFFVGTLLWTLAEIIEGPTMFAYPAVAAPPRRAAGTSGRPTPCSASAPPSARSWASPCGPAWAGLPGSCSARSPCWPSSRPGSGWAGWAPWPP